ncbi:MAG: RNA-binding domain-containing protein [Planctomycetaceae bacterium]
MPEDQNKLFPLPIALDDLIHARTVESVRVEFKKTWDERIRPAVVETICAFANDFQNLYGGYIVLGVEEAEGRPLLPPNGLADQNLDEIQKQIRGDCKGKIDPEYQPVLFPVTFQERQLLVIWAPGGDVRPYQAPNHRKSDHRRTYFVREGCQTVEAQGQTLTELLQLTAKVPFDDRRRNDVPMEDISGELLRQFLRDVHSDLADTNFETAELLRALRLTARTNGHEVPKNAALLLFTRDPERFFPGARVEIAQFADDAGGDLIEERTIRGPIPEQIRSTLTALDGLATNVIRKVTGQAEVTRHVSFPYEAMEEAVANAFLHRSYDNESEPVKVYLYPDRLEIISYPGPVPGLQRKDLEPSARPPHAPLRNRRIGEFLKELRLAEMRSTGLPKIRRRMRENGSPDPMFEFDDERTFFRVTLPAHPEYVVLNALREAAGLWASGNRTAAIGRLQAAHQNAPDSGALIAQWIEYTAADGDLANARSIFNAVEQTPTIRDRHLPYVALARACIEQNEIVYARKLLAEAPPPVEAHDQLERAILHKRNHDLETAHALFQAAFPSLQNNAKAVHEFAQTKVGLAKQVKAKGPHVLNTKRRLTREAVELLRRVIQLNENATRTAWAWFDLAKALEWLRTPQSEVEDAYQHAVALLPDEARFQGWMPNRSQTHSVAPN